MKNLQKEIILFCVFWQWQKGTSQLELVALYRNASPTPWLIVTQESFILMASNSAVCLSSVVNHNDKQRSIKSFPQLIGEFPFKIFVPPNFVILARFESEGSSAYLSKISFMAWYQIGRATFRKSCKAIAGRLTLPSSDSLFPPLPW